MKPPLLLGDATGRVRQIHTTEELTDLDRILLDLGHDATGAGRSLRDRVEDSDTGSGVSSDKLLELAEWTYKNVEEVWSGFNLIADAVAKGARFRGPDRATAWGQAIDVQEKVRMIVINALVYGRAVMEAGEDFLKVRNPRNIEIEQDDDGEITSVTQEIDAEPTELDPDTVWVFTLHRLFSDDVQGISAVQPVIQTVDDQLGARKVNRAIQDRYRAPIRLVEMPEDATKQDRQDVQSQLEQTPPDMDLVLPPGAQLTVLGHGENQVSVDELMRRHFVDRIFMGLGIPKIALGVPDDANRATSDTQRKLLLAQKVQPYQRKVQRFLQNVIHGTLEIEATLEFDALQARDEEMLANVSKILVETGVKTPEEVEARFWDWDEGARGSTQAGSDPDADEGDVVGADDTPDDEEGTPGVLEDAPEEDET